MSVRRPAAPVRPDEEWLSLLAGITDRIEQVLTSVTQVAAATVSPSISAGRALRSLQAVSQRLGQAAG